MDREAVSQLYAEGLGMEQTLRLLDSLLAVASAIESGASTGEGTETSLLGFTLISLCTMIGILVRNVHLTEANDRAIFTATKLTYQIFQKLPLGYNVYHNLLDRALRSLEAELHPKATKISSKMSAESSIHGVLHNLAIKLAGDVFDLLDFDDRNFENSKLGTLLESLNCTLGSINRVLDPLPGGKYAMEGELYNAHLTSRKLPFVPTRISEPSVRYCCCSYKQLGTR